MSQPLSEAPLAYTQALPTVSGHYWVLFGFNDSPLMELITVEDGQAFNLDSDYERHDYELSDENWYAGPIVEPALPEGYVVRPLQPSSDENDHG
ncbi:hypothetical protein [Pseudomonas amygdali]|uniref:Uncharacterized protein n=2 Tax=Pseudomonas amygdali pv. lachrymans TaxID=53707 RepID=A0ABR5KTZ2_PSEAV|nr:hypothetical protein [Pseudomonas amygdali]AXH59734.1 hypothetical protein PLA107_031420 [Pseudomonas amygdali pv. lachrymans str. M301315]KPC17155.1 Uncharacterized protein AC499_0357 [Pseudomonas amygdali pv. lachrymans]KPC18114.1 Uncharacterized protein AC499_1316 [Pseudomonas amygdali pv. lachrymans]RMT05862.1 hypothetical protein ALP54_03636 [Pseudomonas amygdali pv. lachrymans]